MSLQKSVRILGLISALLSQSYNSSYAFVQKPLVINSIELINPSDSNPGMSVKLHFIATQEISDWNLGFYMPFTFKKASNWNPNLKLEICEDSGDGINCGPLQYAENASHDLSAGWTTVFSVNDSSQYVTLGQNKKYVIHALHNGLGVARNYASYPQNFFLINTKTKEVINLTPTTPDMYTVSDYNQMEIDAENTKHIYDNWTNSIVKNDVLNVIPAPVAYQAGNEGEFYQLKNGIKIYNNLYDKNKIDKQFKKYLTNDLGINATIVDHYSSSDKNNVIILETLHDANVVENNPEGYQIKIDAQSIKIAALNSTGAFYALQTLRQLWNANSNLSSMTIIDYPRFKYRGIGLDTARHFRSVSEIKRLIDLMAFHKLNTLHIHFADDEGFRIALPNYPTLTTVGDKRGYGEKWGDNQIGAQLIKQANLDIVSGVKKPKDFAEATDYYTGTYSQKDIKKIVQYANQNKITVIPEIDLPGHARALVKALPNAMFDANDKSDFASVQGFSDNVIPVCTYNNIETKLGKKFTATITDILTQTMEMFNGQETLYALNNEVSIGGDEVNGGTWTTDSSCNREPWAKMTALEKTHYFFQQFSESNPKMKLSGWQQFVQRDDPEGVPPALGEKRVSADKVGHVWIWNSTQRGIGEAQNLADNGYPTVLAFSDQVYFDLTYNKDKTELGQYWATSYADTQAALSSAVSASQSMQNLDPSNKTNIVGIEGELWSENLVTSADMFYMTTPKMAGLAEAGWSSENITTDTSGRVSWQSLATRLGCGKDGFLAQLHKLFKVEYRGYDATNPRGIALEVPTDICNKM